MRYPLLRAFVGVATSVCLLVPGPAGAGTSATAAEPSDRIVFAYSSKQLKPRGIFSVRPDGSGSRRLVKGYVDGIEWSPDGRKIAFSRQRCPSRNDCDSFIYMMNPNGSRVRRLGGNADAILGFDWSPDSRSVVYSAFDQEAFDYDLRVATRGERRTVALTDTPGAEETFPDWSPDGSEIAFARSSDGVNDIFAISVDDETERNLTNDAPGDSQPRWSPDGQHIAYVTTRDDESVGEDAPYTNQLYVMRPDGSEPQRISTNDDTRKFDPQWSADSTKLAWHEECDHDYCDTDFDIWVAEIGGEARNVTDDRRFYDQSPQWSPNGRRLVFVRWRRTSSKTGIFSIRVNGSRLKEVRDAPGPESLVDWQTW